MHAEPAAYVDALATHSGACARAPFVFVGTPCLKHEAECDFTVPVMALFAFLAQPHLPVRAASFNSLGTVGSSPARINARSLVS